MARLERRLRDGVRLHHRIGRLPDLIYSPEVGNNFFELAVATAIALYGPACRAALATVVGVLVEVPVMLSVCRFWPHLAGSTKRQPWQANGDRLGPGNMTLT